MKTLLESGAMEKTSISVRYVRCKKRLFAVKGAPTGRFRDPDSLRWAPFFPSREVREIISHR